MHGAWGKEHGSGQCSVPQSLNYHNKYWNNLSYQSNDLKK
jgi:hypothetical protein